MLRFILKLLTTFFLLTSFLLPLQVFGESVSVGGASASTLLPQQPQVLLKCNTQIPLYSYSGSLDEGRGKVRETSSIATPKKEDTTPALAERPLDRGTGEASPNGKVNQTPTQSSTLNFGRRSYNPTQGIFTTEDPLTQGVSYNTSGTDQLVGENHQSIGNVGLNAYNLINQNPMGGKDVDGYDTQTDINNNNNAIQSQQDFYTSYKNTYSTDIEHYQGVINQIKQDKASGLYDVYPSWQQYAYSPEKLANDNLATQIAFAAICSSDTTYPYGCNSYHSQIAKNYDLSVSPNIRGFSKYRIDNKTISQTYFDKLIEYDTKLTLASLNLSILDQGNKMAMESLANQSRRLDDVLKIEFNEYKTEDENLYTENHKPQKIEVRQSGMVFAFAGNMAVSGLITTQADSPAPGPADLVGGGMLLIGGAAFVVASGYWAYEQIATTSTTGTTTSSPSLPSNPDDLLDDGYELDTLHQYGKRYKNPNGDVVDYHPGTPGAKGWAGKDHYHRHNPNSTGKGDKYLDADGNPVPGGSGGSHIPVPPAP